MAKSPFEKVFSAKVEEIDEKVKTSFTLIRQDIAEMQKTVDAMRNYLKTKDNQYQYAKKEDNKIRDEFRRDVDEFTQKLTQLKLALSEVRTIGKESVLVRDLAKIEDRIKISFKNEIEGYKDQINAMKQELRKAEGRINALEMGIVLDKKKKKGWFKKSE